MVWSGASPSSQLSARRVDCNRCGKKGHYGSVCHSKGSNVVPTNTVTTDSLALETTLLRVVGAVMAREHKQSWTLKLHLEGQKMLYTGAKVVGIRIRRVLECKPPDTVQDVLWPNLPVTRFKVMGQFRGTLKLHEQTSTQLIFVVKGAAYLDS